GVWPLSSRPEAPTRGQSISRARAPAGTLPSVTHVSGLSVTYVSGLRTAELRLAAFTGLPPPDVPEPRAPRPAGAALFRLEGSGHAPALRCARGLPLKSNGDPSATPPRMRNAIRCSRGHAPLTRREVMNDESGAASPATRRRRRRPPGP